MPIESDGDGNDEDNNDGPHCRNCHVGASNCDVCHASTASAYTSTVTAGVAARSPYASQAWVKTSASTTLGSKCLDGGFSFPHRTLGANMLKDELYGINYDGTLAALGSTRTANGVPSDTDGAVRNFELWTTEGQNGASLSAAVRTDSGVITGAEVENLDSVCIDCHGDSTYWNGDGLENSSNPYYTVGAADTTYTGVYGSGDFGGWDLLLKGLP